jgi:hypothetical protein
MPFWDVIQTNLIGDECFGFIEAMFTPLWLSVKGDNVGSRMEEGGMAKVERTE